MSAFIVESFIRGAVAAATSKAPNFYDLCDRLLLVGMRRHQPNASLYAAAAARFY